MSKSALCLYLRSGEGAFTTDCMLRRRICLTFCLMSKIMRIHSRTFIKGQKRIINGLKWKNVCLPEKKINVLVYIHFRYKCTPVYTMRLQLILTKYLQFHRHCHSQNPALLLVSFSTEPANQPSLTRKKHLICIFLSTCPKCTSQIQSAETVRRYRFFLIAHT